ncbi:MAG: hypothetical protein Q9222_004570 [Ikaeria aurantiellina]
MNDDLQAAEDGLADGNSSFHKLGKGMVAFLRATLGFEPEVMREGEPEYAAIHREINVLTLFSLGSTRGCRINGFGRPSKSTTRLPHLPISYLPTRI